jgi:hypothetical protein
LEFNNPTLITRSIDALNPGYAAAGNESSTSSEVAQ